MPAPTSPTAVAAVAAVQAATVSWTSPSSDGGSVITSYTVTPFIGTAPQTPVTFLGNDTTPTSVVINGLLAGTAYTFTVYATNALGSSGPSSPSSSVTIVGVPTAPLSVRAIAGDTQATVMWSAPVNDGGSVITGYTITPYIGVTAQTPATVSGSTFSHTFTGLVNGTTYTFTVTATNAIGSGPASTSNAVTPNPLGAPISLVGVPGDTVATLNWSPPLSPGGTITDYTVRVFDLTGTLLSTIDVGSPVLAFLVTGLTNGSSYTFTVSATTTSAGPQSVHSNVVTPAPASGPLAIQTSSLRADVWDHSRTVFRGSLGGILNLPTLKSTLNGGFHQIELQVEAASQIAGIQVGDFCSVFEALTGEHVFDGTVNDNPHIYDADATYSLVLDPLVTELESNPFVMNYAAATDVGQMIRDIVSSVQAGGGHIAVNDTSSAPGLGVTGIFNFDTSYNCLTALEECVRIAGIGWYFFVDETGLLWFQQVDYTKAPTHRLAMTTDYVISRREGPVDNLCNFVQVYGASPTDANGNVTGPPIVATYDVSSGSPYGRRALTPALTYPNVSDQATLQQIANTVGSVLSLRTVQYHITMPYFAHSPGTRVSMAIPSSATAALYEPGTLPDQPQFQGQAGTITGALGALVVQDVEIDGVTQQVLLGDLPYTMDDLQYIADQMAARAATSTVATGSSTGTVGGGVTIPGTPGPPGPPGSSVCCGGEVMMAEAVDEITVTGGVVVEVPLVIDEANVRIHLECEISVIASGTPTDVPNFQLGINPGGINNRSRKLSAGGTWNGGGLHSPPMSVLPQGSYTAYLHINGVSSGSPWSNGTLQVQYQMLIWLVTSGNG